MVDYNPTDSSAAKIIGYTLKRRERIGNLVFSKMLEQRGQKLVGRNRFFERENCFPGYPQDFDISRIARSQTIGSIVSSAARLSTLLRTCRSSVMPAQPAAPFSLASSSSSSR